MRNSSNAPTAHGGGHRDPRINTVDPVISRRQLEDALASLKEQVIRCPGDPLTHNNLGVIYCRLADKENALASFQRAVDLAPSDLTMRKNLAFFLTTECGNHEAALKIYTELLAESPYDADTLQAIASICTTLGDRKSAFFFHKKAITVEPWNSAAWEFMERVIEQGLAHQRSVTDVVAPHTGGISATTLHELALASHEILNKATGAEETDRPGGGNISHPRDCAQQPAVSIVIPLFNKVELTAQCLKALGATTDPSLFELILVDNGSTDGTGALLATLPATITAIRNERNLGFATACNQGAQVASGRYLLFLNNDTEPQRKWLEPMIEMIESEPDIGAVGSKLLFPDGTIQHAGVLVIEDQKMPDLLVARHVFYGQPADTPGANRPMQYKVLTAACLMVRRDLFGEVGGFDSGYWNGYEDVDLCFTLGANGWRLAYQPASVVIHHESKSGKERFTKVEDNIRRLHEKWMGRVRPDAVIDTRGEWHWIQDDSSWHTLRDPAVAAAGSPSPGSGTAGVVSIVILTFNQLWCTRECVESIRRFTPEPHEIIFVDNGSTDGTVAWIKELLSHNAGYQLIENATNLGFAAGCNQGIEASRGEYLLLLNNDVVVTRDWLAGMLESLLCQPDTGIVGPMTNNISGIQRVTDIGYDNMSGLDRYAAWFREANRHRRIETRRVVGFCMLFRKTLAQAIGLLDENFGSGNFEDDDYCLRAELAGYRNIIAGDVFIHHYGSQSFAANRIDYSAAMTRNMALYRSKWDPKQLDERTLRRLLLHDAVREGRRLALRGNVEEAIDLLVNKGIRVDPASLKPYAALVEILCNEERFEDALQVLPEMPPDTDAAYLNEASALCHAPLGNDDAAEDAARQALAGARSRPTAMVTLGTLSARRGNLAEAEAWFRKAVESDPSCAAAWQSMSMLRWGEGDRDGAWQALMRSVVLNPLKRDAVDLFCDMATRLSYCLPEAVRTIKDAHGIYPDSRHLARAFIHLAAHGRQEAVALSACESFLATFGPDDQLLDLALSLRNRAGAHNTIDRAGPGSISLCMIVKDEAANLPSCLASLKPVVDEIVIVDTGSTDRTADIATVFGARVETFSWNGNFSDARNVSLASARGAWILVMDADELLSPRDYEAVRSVVHGGASTTVWSVMTRNYTCLHPCGWVANDGSYPDEERSEGWHPSTKVRLFPNDPQLRFSGDVHEMVEQSAAAASYLVDSAPFVVHHYGELAKTTSEDQVKKLAYFTLGKKKLAEHPDDLAAIGELAVQAAELGRYDEAVSLWDRFLQLAPATAVAFFNKGFALMQLNRFREALEVTRHALELDPDLKEAAFNFATCKLYTGAPEEGIVVAEEYVSRYPDYPLLNAILVALYLAAEDHEHALLGAKKLLTQNYSISQYIRERADVLATQGNVTLADRLRTGIVILDNHAHPMGSDEKQNSRQQR